MREKREWSLMVTTLLCEKCVQRWYELLVLKSRLASAGSCLLLKET